jgi:flagellar biosynthesis protein FliP
MTWKSAVALALALFLASLAIAPVFAPAQQKLAAQINSQTLRAAAAIEASRR